jgi:hypothetical protein
MKVEEAIEIIKAVDKHPVFSIGYLQITDDRITATWVRNPPKLMSEAEKPSDGISHRT